MGPQFDRVPVYFPGLMGLFIRRGASLCCVVLSPDCGGERGDGRSVAVNLPRPPASLPLSLPLKGSPEGRWRNWQPCSVAIHPDLRERREAVHDNVLMDLAAVQFYSHMLGSSSYSIVPVIDSSMSMRCRS